MNLFVSCAIGLEPVLANELNNLVDASIKPTRAGVWVDGVLADAYSVCLWSRVASRVLLPVFASDATVENLYNTAVEHCWSEYLEPGAGIAIDFSGKNKHIRHTGFGALKIKDAIADWHRARGLEPPHLEKDEPEIRFSARINKGKVSVALDFSGHAMHRRGYRQRQGAAPLRENLAASLLYRAKWPEIARAGGDLNAVLVDPMCGSGTLVIEAALMATDGAPGLRREFWGFDHWPGHDAELWNSMLQAAEQRFRQGREAFKGCLYASDNNAFMVKAARGNAARAAVDGLIEFQTEDATCVRVQEATKGLLITNPPYGERLGDEAQVALLYERFGENLMAEFEGWQAAILAANSEFGRRLGMHSYKQYRVDNGRLACMLLLFDIQPESRLAKKQVIEPSEGAGMLANRIGKNMAKMNAWISRENIQAFRVYDADIPEYAAAIDLYRTDHGRYAVVQEYAPPGTVDASKARHRLNEIVTGAGLALAVGDDRIHVRCRRRQRGSRQYEKNFGHDPHGKETSGTVLVREGKAVLEVNLQDYLDTGLFLDHRPIRREINRLSAGKSFLNLFCYTSAVTVQAAVGGARRSLSVDMSNTYLTWAERNFMLNHMDLSRHRLMREDCLKLLHRQSLSADEKFDLIFLDPPSFSNSKRMEEVLDIQKDHARLIQQTMCLLEKDGILIFSTNFRKFKMDVETLSEFELVDYTSKSLDPDFQRNQRIHQCWKVWHKDHAH